MDKFEFSDLYKFLVSAGIILIGIATLMPWFYLKEPFDLLIEKNKILLLTPEAQFVVANRQAFIGRLSSIIPWTSAILFFAGVLSIIFGLKKWFNKQAEIDKRDTLTTEKLEKEVKSMSPADVVNKNESEFNEATNINSDIENTTTTTTSTPTKNEFISNYTHIEQFFSSRLTSVYQNRFKILTNIRLNNRSFLAEYDLVLNSGTLSRKDYIFEFKYYPNGVTKKTIQEVIIKMDWRAKVYSDKIKNNIMSILLIALPTNKYNDERCTELKKLPKEISSITTNIKIEFINSDKLDNLDDSYFELLLD
ncbi:hypothetical protein [Mucilaginibacter glaciei]|uniref:Uncharacterized protein n=1 Tax=Mucilaginibacter glaciei TaxID=2772109 RepID=A0A926NVE1_9SPHI|nr:hypothetical protein [Mucilaginibacter glaciei]MBD1392488.1 hypothetical protein [Mucilaginibacter glaciei]